MASIRKHVLNYQSGGIAFVGTVLQPAETAARAAVILLPDWRGQSVLAHQHAEFLVAAGCVVAIADLYGNGFNPTDPADVGPMVKQLLENRQAGVSALQACATAFETFHKGKIPVFCLGYSAGGMMALDFGRNGAKVAGLITCSALLKTAEAGGPTRISAPVLILQGTEDVVSPMSVINDLVAEMDAAGNDLTLQLYSQTHHAFDNPDAGTDPAARLCYSPSAANRARQAILAFIGREDP